MRYFEDCYFKSYAFLTHFPIDCSTVLWSLKTLFKCLILLHIAWTQAFPQCFYVHVIPMSNLLFSHSHSFSWLALTCHKALQNEVNVSACLLRSGALKKLQSFWSQGIPHLQIILKVEGFFCCFCILSSAIQNAQAINLKEVLSLHSQELRNNAFLWGWLLSLLPLWQSCLSAVL